MVSALKSKIKLKTNQRCQIEQLAIVILIVGIFLAILSTFGLIERKNLGTFILLSLLFGTLGFALLEIRTIGFFNTQRKTIEKSVRKLKELSRIAKEKELAIEEVRASLLDLSFKEGVSSKTREALGKIAKVVSGTKAVLWLPKNDELELAACWGIEPEGIEQTRLPLTSRSAAAKTFKTGQAIISAKPSSDPRFNQRLVDLVGAKQVANVPLKIGRETYGVLAVLNKTEGAFNKDDISLLRAIAFPMASCLRHTSLAEEFERKVEEEHKFLTDFAHQIKTSLTATYGEIELALAKKGESERKKAMRFVLECLRKSSRTIQEALDLSWTKIAKERQENVNLRQILVESCEVAAVIAEQKEINISLNGASKLYTLAERNKILQAVMNILDNAVKYTNIGGRITIDLKRKDNFAQITVKDSGVGIPKRDVGRVFERFWRGQIANAQDGSGLGLSITKSIVEMYGGTIELKSWVGKGTQVQIKLPLAK
jgi:signal transduction histidine kinase